MPKYIVSGDLTYGGKVLVEADSPEEAIRKAEMDDWDEVYDRTDTPGFEFCGTETEGVELLEEEAATGMNKPPDDVLENARIVLWFCPTDPHHNVRWERGEAGMVPHCIAQGCGQVGAPR